MTSAMLENQIRARLAFDEFVDAVSDNDPERAQRARDQLKRSEAIYAEQKRAA